MKKTLLLLFLSLTIISSLNIPDAEAYNPEGFKKFVNYIESMARSQGISQATLHKAFKNIKFNYKIVAQDSKQPERHKGPGFQQYKSRVLTQKRIDQAKEMLDENGQLLEDIEKQYGIEKEILVALWAVESGFGKTMGNYDTISSLTSLAYEGRRRAFFQDELLKALVILDQGHVDKEHFKGSWAGAFGQVQFMPSTFMKYAVDYDGDGKKDLWYNNGDALASAANYLKSIGWQSHIGSWGKRVILTKNIDSGYFNKDYFMPMNKWKTLGLRYADGSSIPNKMTEAALIDPDGKYGNRQEVYLVTENFAKIMEWNRSTYFATSIGLIADSIK